MFFEENKIFETILNKETSQAFHLYKAIRKETYSGSQSDHISRVNFPLSNNCWRCLFINQKTITSHL